MDGKTIYFLGKLAASNRKLAAEAVRRCGGKVAQELTPKVQIVVVGEGDILAQNWNLWNDQLDAATRDAFESGSLEIVSETFFWDQYGNSQKNDHLSKISKIPKTCYTLSMLAELTGVPISVIRQLQKQQLIVPVRQIHRLSYFDVESILPLKIVRNMFDAGLPTNTAIDRLRKIKRNFPTGRRQIDVQVNGRNVVLVTEKGLINQDGQYYFSFLADDEEDKSVFVTQREPLEILESVLEPLPEPNNVETIYKTAWLLESAGNLQGAIDLYRATLAAGNPNPQIHFQIAELLYRLGDLTAARERYFMAIELDETFVEARANLGCVLAELGNDELAAAAFRGALKYHPDYAEVRFHLGMLLKRVGLTEEANEHFRIFLELMPDSPWAEQIS
ncbi:MAG: tetratricopeptide repeat protein [Planctomycetaceae bacterium]|jgi:tetratricopeptide (TPR) repeat protein|nr:tetratricopeptide repeat protein [Planctomycetaceae bacterium]